MIGRKAITMVETVSYLGLFAVIFSVVVAYFYFTDQANDDQLRRQEFERLSIYLDEHITSSLRENDSIDTVSSILDADQGSLYLDDSTNVYIYFLENGILKFSRNGQESNLTSSNYTVEKLRFDRIERTDNSIGGVKFTIELSDPDLNVSKTFGSSYLVNQ